MHIALALLKSAHCVGITEMQVRNWNREIYDLAVKIFDHFLHFFPVIFDVYFRSDMSELKAFFGHMPPAFIVAYSAVIWPLYDILVE
jgi:hypothetical protein